ncbi:MAG: phosphoglycerate mutase, partial [Candidatus Aegiribacteria sp.]|nr:phosphoglycerate mutase [Candidatus Aegiribacteria sp.]
MYKGLTEELARTTDSRILLAVIDGVGDVSNTELGGRTPLEAAETQHLDRLASESALGLHTPVSTGITPGSGPAHLALFGYDPVTFNVGRGVLAALGMEFDLEYRDLVARINFCTIDDDGIITDRRAGRISTEKCIELVELLSVIEIRDVDIFVLPVKQHRACVVFRGEGLDDNIKDTDPGL